MQTLKVGVANIYRNTEENYQCTIPMPYGERAEKIFQTGICFAMDHYFYPIGQRLIGKFDHLKRVLEQFDISEEDLMAKITTVPSKKSSSYGR